MPKKSKNNESNSTRWPQVSDVKSGVTKSKGFYIRYLGQSLYTSGVQL